MNKKNNRQHQDTTQKIIGAFWTMLKTEPFQNITVSELCSQAEINKSTFYGIYDDIKELSLDVIEKIDTHLYEMGKEQKQGNLTWLFQHILEHREDYSVYFSLCGRFSYNYAVCISSSDMETDYFKTFWVNGIHAIVKTWLSDGCTDTPEKMNEVVQSIPSSN